MEKFFRSWNSRRTARNWHQAVERWCHYIKNHLIYVVNLARGLRYDEQLRRRRLCDLIEASASYNCVIQPAQTTSCVLSPACLISIKSMNHDVTIRSGYESKCGREAESREDRYEQA
jgi:hypothetical protein